MGPAGPLLLPGGLRLSEIRWRSAVQFGESTLLPIAFSGLRVIAAVRGPGKKKGLVTERVRRHARFSSRGFDFLKPQPHQNPGKTWVWSSTKRLRNWHVKCFTYVESGLGKIEPHHRKTTGGENCLLRRCFVDCAAMFNGARRPLLAARRWCATFRSADRGLPASQIHADDSTRAIALLLQDYLQRGECPSQFGRRRNFSMDE